MNIFPKRIALAVMSGLLIIATVNAQEQTTAPLGAVEILGCNFNSGKNMNDLNAVVRKYNAWSDSHNMDQYTALILTPLYHSAEMTFDVLWLGAWPNGTAMGKDTVVWINDGEKMLNEFNRVMDCSVFLQLASLNVRPPSGPVAAGAIADFTDCKVKEGRTSQEAIAAIAEWAQYLADNGSDLPHWVNFPVAGESADADYDFKLSTGFSDPVAYGKFMDFYTSKGYSKANELFGRLMDCNSARVYAIIPARVAAGD